MKKFSFFLIVLLLTRVGTTYAAPDTTKGLDIQNFFLGSSVNNVNVNQVLALLVGPQGKPGVAGVAGQDGFVGMNGVAGQDGLPGAPGPVGPQGPQGIQGIAGVAGPAGPAGPTGAGVASVIVASGDATCANGGAKFITADGTSTYACNGAAGAAGATGPQGPTGLTGLTGPGVTLETEPAGANCENGGSKLTTSAGDVSYVCSGAGGGPIEGGTGTATIAACDDSVLLGMLSHYSVADGDFFLDGIRVQGLKGACSNRQVTITLSIAGSAIVCQFDDLTNLENIYDNDAYFVDNISKGLDDLATHKHRIVATSCSPSLSTVHSRLLDATIAFQFG